MMRGEPRAYRLVNQHFGVEEPEDEYTEEADATKVAAEDVAQEAEDITEEADAVAESATATEHVLTGDVNVRHYKMLPNKFW